MVAVLSRNRPAREGGMVPLGRSALWRSFRPAGLGLFACVLGRTSSERGFQVSNIPQVGAHNVNGDVGPRVVFLLGAGASIEAGVSTSDKITEIMANYGAYCPSAESAAIENLVKYIQVRIADYEGWGHIREHRGC
jgi:hypothetical protein